MKIFVSLDPALETSICECCLKDPSRSIRFTPVSVTIPLVSEHITDKSAEWKFAADDLRKVDWTPKLASTMRRAQPAKGRYRKRLARQLDVNESGGFHRAMESMIYTYSTMTEVPESIYASIKREDAALSRVDALLAEATPLGINVSEEESALTLAHECFMDKLRHLHESELLAKPSDRVIASLRPLAEAIEESVKRLSEKVRMDKYDLESRVLSSYEANEAHVLALLSAK